MSEDYFTPIWIARKEFYKKQLEFEDILDNWEEENEKMGNFVIGLNFKDKNEVYIRFEGDSNNDKVNMSIVEKACEDFNLQIMHKLTDQNYYHDHVTTRFILRHKTKPFGL